MPRVIFIEPDGNRRDVEAPSGRSVMEIARDNGLDIEGACEGCMACATCHVVVAPGDYDRLAEPSEDEEDMLDLVIGVTETSRLGCQIVMSDALDGLTVTLPDRVRNMLMG